MECATRTAAVVAAAAAAVAVAFLDWCLVFCAYFFPTSWRQ